MHDRLYHNTSMQQSIQWLEQLSNCCVWISRFLRISCTNTYVYRISSNHIKSKCDKFRGRFKAYRKVGNFPGHCVVMYSVCITVPYNLCTSHTLSNEKTLSDVCRMVYNITLSIYWFQYTSIPRRHPTTLHHRVLVMSK